MGVYLSSLRNAKANPTTGSLPDENYARELMQLFTIGLWDLHPDGTLFLDGEGRPQPTYTQTTISETAKVMTGWGFYSTATNPNFRGAKADYLSPMMLYPAFHDTTAKTLAGGVVLPAGQSGGKDLEDLLDTLVNHRSTAPFVARQLIQRLVTSNPSPGYVYRVAQVFANDGSGNRGNLGAMVRAILLDYEARAEAPRGNVGYGKLKEPLLRVTNLLRAGKVSTATGRYSWSNPEGNLGQAVLRSPTVFNFFEPGYSPQGTLATAGLQAPEFQILTSTSAITVANQLYSFIYSTPNGFTLDWSELTALADRPEDLVAKVDLWLCAGGMSPDERARIVKALGAVPRSTSALDRVRLAVYLACTTAAGAIQR